MKKIKLLLFGLLVCLLTVSSVNADTTCKYIGDNKNGQLTITFTIFTKKEKVKLTGNECIVDGYVDSDDEEYVSNDAEFVDNWKKTQLNESQTGKEYFEKTGECPPYAIWTDELGHFNVYVSDEKDLNIFINEGRKKQGYQVLKLLNQNLVGKSYTINFVKNMNAATGSMSSIPAVYGERVYIPETGYKLSGYSVVGYRIYNNGKWKCREGGYKTECKDEYDYEIVGSDAMTMIEFDPSDPNVYLYAEWELNANISSQTINQYFEGEKAEEHCTGSGFVWNEKNGGYCNTDKLQYVTCGDSYDIPSEVPRLISYFVNLLKILAPIILIVVSMISLLKALTASKEDELKKAQSSLVKKIIAAVMIFFVVSIVQFVILKVADSSETKSISNCMSCFLNNDCTDTTYYKTNIGGVYHCTLVTQTGRSKIKSCNDFYKEIKEEYTEN